jgi:hypothetical protein
MTQETLKKMYQLLLTEPHAPTVCVQLERIAREALAEHAMREVQRLGREIEPDDIASILACRNMLDAQPVLRRAFEAQSSIESIKYWANAYSNPESGPHFHGHGMVSRLLTEYANLVEALAQPEQEPVAYYLPHKGFYWAKPTSISAPTIADVEPLPLYTHPPKETK